LRGDDFIIEGFPPGSDGSEWLSIWGVLPGIDAGLAAAASRFEYQGAAVASKNLN
jgi:hypothetical protein